MTTKNTFLPLISYRNYKKNKILKNATQSLIKDISSSSLKKYHGSFQDKNMQFSKLMERKDKQALSLVKKYMQKFEGNKKSLYRIGYVKRYDSQIQNRSKSQQKQKSLQKPEQRQIKLIKIRTLIKSLQVSPKKQKQQLLNRKNSGQMSSQQMRRMKSLLFKKQKRNTVLRSRQQLIDRYGVLKNKVSKSLQNDLKIIQYESQRQSKRNSVSLQNKISIIPNEPQQLMKNPQKISIVSNFQKLNQQNQKIIQTLQKVKLHQKQAPQKTKIKYKKPKQRANQKISNKILNYRLDTIQPWENQELNQML